MKVNLTAIIKNNRGIACTGEDGQPLSYRDAIWVALNNYQTTEQPTPDDKLKSFKLSNKIYEKDPDITTQEAAFIIERAGLISPPLLYGRILELLDPSFVAPAEK